MKKTIITTIIYCLFTLIAIAQKNNPDITIILKNSSLLPIKCTVISYAPNETGNGTQGCMLAPLGTKKLTFKEGTKLYLANGAQVNTVMSGKRIDNNQPFLVVKKEDNNQTFKF